MSLKLEDVSFVYGAGTSSETKALNNVNLEINKGEFVAIIGHTGSGKSTLIQHFNGLEKATSGNVYYDGKNIADKGFDIRGLRCKVGLVFQYPEHQLFEESVIKDVCFGPLNQGCTKEQAIEKAKEALQLVGVREELYEKTPFELSGGQKRRVAIAGVLAMNPEILILDEPTAGLDPAGRDKILNRLKELREKKGIGIVLVSHSMEDVANYAERIIVMNKGQVMYDDAPHNVFKHYKKLEQIGLAAPQITYIMHQLKEDGLDVDENIINLEEAKERDHRKIGKDMELFMVDDLVGRGLPMFLPKGYVIWQELENYIKDKERKLGYQHVMTPCVGTVNLYKTSGHWDHYKENMFPPMEMEGESFVLRPMNCPHHMMIYANKRHSYKNLPIRIGEIAHDFRYESSGTLKGIERGRHFCQNDAHLFVTPEQIKDEFTKVVELIFSTYKDFGITNYRCVLSLRDPENKEKYHDDDEMWNTAEDALRDVMNSIGIEYTEEIGEAAFYGPKLDVNVQPAIGNEITLSTCQLDFCLPAKFNLSYIDSNGEKQTPVVLHRAILGSLDRFMAYILEETKGNLPTWLAPVQARVMPVKTDDEGLNAYAQEIVDALEAADVRVELDDRAEKLGYRMREGQVEKVPYLLVVGFNEKDDRTVSFRLHGEKETTVLPLDTFVEKIKAEIAEKSREHIHVN